MGNALRAAHVDDRAPRAGVGGLDQRELVDVFTGGDDDARDIFLCREELDRLGRRHGRDVAGLEAEHPHPCYELALELRVVELARDDLAGRHLAGGSDGDFQDDLPLQRRLVTQRPAVQRVDRRLVPIEHELDFLTRSRGLEASTSPLDLVRRRRSRRWRRDPRRVVSRETRRASAESAARRGYRDATTALSHLGGQERPVDAGLLANTRVERLRVRPGVYVELAELGELLRQRQQAGARRLLLRVGLRLLLRRQPRLRWWWLDHRGFELGQLELRGLRRLDLWRRNGSWLWSLEQELDDTFRQDRWRRTLRRRGQ